MKTAVKYICDASPIYVYLKKHFCPNCAKRLELRYVSKIVNSKSPESKDYDFSLVDTRIVGDVEFRTKCFYCSQCNLNISFEYMKEFEASVGSRRIKYKS